MAIGKKKQKDHRYIKTRGGGQPVKALCVENEIENPLLHYYYRSIFTSVIGRLEMLYGLIFPHSM